MLGLNEIFCRKPEGYRAQLKDLGIDGRRVLQFILKIGWEIWNGLILISGGLL